MDTNGSVCQPLVYFIYEPEGTLKLKKTSSKAAVTNNLSSYSLNGAIYGVYSSEVDANSDKNRIETLVTAENGESNIINIASGVYYVREVTAPIGYQLDDKNHLVTVSSGGTNILEVADEPHYDHVGIVVTKVDRDTKLPVATGAGTLSGAEFTVKYYDTQENISGINPLRTWIFETDENGYVKYNSDYKLSGDELFNYGNLEFIPLGTITIQETKAPSGYQLDTTVYTRVIEVDTDLDTVRVDNVTEVEEPVIRGGVQIVKYDASFATNVAQGGATLEGAEFEIINKTGKSVVVDGKICANNTVVKTIKTNELGIAKTDVDTLPYGEYIIRESAAPEGYEIPVTGFYRAFLIEANKQMVYLVGDDAIKEPVIRGGVQISKYDEDFGYNAAQGSASLEGAKFEIINNNDKSVVIDGEIKLPGTIVKEIYTNELGVARTDVDALPYGQYIIRESEAPRGYRIPEIEYYKSFEIKESNQMVYLWEGNAIKDPVIRGGVQITKYDAELNTNAAQGGATLEGAEFQIINNSDKSVVVDGDSKAPGTIVKTIYTNELGVAKTDVDTLPYGKYIIKETVASEGYTIPQTGYYKTFEITELYQYIYLTGEDAIKEPILKGGVIISKYDDEFNVNAAQGGATLEGAEFDIINKSGRTVVVDGKTYMNNMVVKTIHTNELGIAQTDNYVLPFGDYYICEVGAPDGYTISESFSRAFSITKNGEMVDLTGDNAIKEPVIRGGVRIAKYDIEHDTNELQGGATLEGAIFEIVNANVKSVVINGVTYKPNTVVMKIKTDALGIAETGYRDLPYGDYIIKEVEEPTGYLLEGILERTFTIEKDGVIVDMTGTDGAIKNYVKRGDLALTKIADGSMNRMVGVPFKITSIDTGESVTIITDENGYASTASSWNKHSSNTNRAESYEDGVWLGPLEALDESRGALPYGYYEVEELECEVNEDMVITPPFTIRIYKDSYIVDLETITNDFELIPYISTNAYDYHTDIREGALSYETILHDTVMYYDTTIGQTYTLVGTLMNRITKEPILVNGEEVQGTTTFIADKVRGSVEVEFIFDGTSLDSVDIVVFEKLYNSSGAELANHEEIRDNLQTVSYFSPSISTTAVDKDKWSEEGILSCNTTIIDRVIYQGLVPGRDYTVSGILMDKATGEPVLVDGEVITATQVFSPKDMSGYIDIEFVFDGTSFEDMDIVVFERLIDVVGNVVATHEDIEDENQTVTYRVPEDGPEDSSEDSPEDVPEDSPEDVPEDSPEDTQEDVTEDQQEDEQEDEIEHEEFIGEVLGVKKEQSNITYNDSAKTQGDNPTTGDDTRFRGFLIMLIISGGYICLRRYKRRAESLTFE